MGRRWRGPASWMMGLGGAPGRRRRGPPGSCPAVVGPEQFCQFQTDSKDIIMQQFLRHLLAPHCFRDIARETSMGGEGRGGRVVRRCSGALPARGGEVRARSRRPGRGGRCPSQLKQPQSGFIRHDQLKWGWLWIFRVNPLWAVYHKVCIWNSYIKCNWSIKCLKNAPSNLNLKSCNKQF